MPKRPAQGRGSGGRVTPSPKAPSSDASTSSSSAGSRAPKGRVPKATTKPGKGGGATTSATSSAKGGSTKQRAASTSSKAAGRRAETKQAKGDTKDGGKEQAASKKGGLATKDATTAREVDATEAAEPRRGLLAQLLASPAGGEDGYVAPKDRVRPWWGMGDMLLFFLVAQVAAGVAFFYVANALGYSIYWPVGPGSRVGEVVGRMAIGQAPQVTKTLADMPIEVTTLLQIPLWAGFIGGPIYAVKRKGFTLARDFGLKVEWRDIPMGLGIGVFAQLVLVTLLYKVLFLFTPEQDVSAAARETTDKANGPLSVLIILLVVGVGAPFAEELFFRGLSQHAITKRFAGWFGASGGAWFGVVLGAVFFAFAHSQALQFPGLLLFGLIAGYLVKRYDRLGPAIFAHAGFNITTAVVLIGNFNLP